MRELLYLHIMEQNETYQLATKSVRRWSIGKHHLDIHLDILVVFLSLITLCVQQDVSVLPYFSLVPSVRRILEETQHLFCEQIYSVSAVEKVVFTMSEALHFAHIQKTLIIAHVL